MNTPKTSTSGSPIERGEVLTHKTGTNVTSGGTTRLRRAPADNDHPVDSDHPERWEQATAPNRNTALSAAGLCTPDDDLPPPTYGQRAAPAGRPVYSLGPRALLRSVRHGVPRQTVGHQGGPYHARPRNRAARGGRRSHHCTQGPRGPAPARGPSPSPGPGPDHLGAGRLPPGTGHALPVPVDQAALAIHHS